MLTCFLSNGTAARIRQAVISKSMGQLENILNPAEYCAGGKQVLSSAEERMIADRMKFIEARGFAMNHNTLKEVMYAITRDGGKGFKNGFPSDDVVRLF